MFTLIIFFIILAVLILTHELGHFLVAKWNGIKVEEFGLGFPPRLWGKKFGETFYSLNWIPFGGFVKILGEDPTSEIDPDAQGRSMMAKPRYRQALVLAAGVAFNFIFAWIIISGGLLFGLPTSRAGVPEGYQLERTQLIIMDVAKDSPAANAGLRGGQIISYLTDGTFKLADPSIEETQKFIAERENFPVVVGVIDGLESNKPAVEVKLTPKGGIAAGKAGIGVSLDEVGLLKLPFFPAIREGLRLSVMVTGLIVTTLWDLLTGAFQGETAALSSVTGPVGLVTVVGSSLALGFSYLLNLTAVISLNLAVINLLPFPALDGGRILFLAIEGVRRRAISPRIVNALNSTGFFILLALMVLLTYRDIINLIR